MPHRINRLQLLIVGVLLLTGPGNLMAPPSIPGDLDGDLDVDARDIDGFIACISGEGVPPTPVCMSADLYGDGDVDQADFGLMQRCISGENVLGDPDCTGLSPRLDYYGNGGCMSAGLLDDDYPWCGDDVVEIAVEGHSLHVFHRNATYNCCPDDIRVELTVGGSTLLLEETEILTMPCLCLCCYDVESVVVDLPPAYYQVEYCWDDGESGPMCDVQFILVP